MRRFLAVALAAALLITLSGTAFAAKGGNGGGNGGGSGNPAATISLMAPVGAAPTGSWPAVGSSVSFVVSANVKPNQVPYLWVANWCYQNGAAVYVQFQGVQNWTSGPFSLSWNGGAASCTAYVFLFPNTNTPLAGGTTTYSVSG